MRSSFLIAVFLLCIASSAALARDSKGGAAATGLEDARADSLPEAARVDSLPEPAAPPELGKRELKDEMARLGASEVAGPREWERKKNPKVAMFSSMALPGLGQLYNGRRYKTILAAGFFTFYMTYAWVERKQADRRLEAREQYPPGSLAWKQENLFYEFHKENARTFLWWAGAVWLISALDAFVDAHLYDVRSVKPTVVQGSDDVKYLTLSLDF